MMQIVSRRMGRGGPRLKPLIFRPKTTCGRPLIAGACSIYPHGFSNRRTIIQVSPLLLPPLVFSGLVLALWTWKCFMMIAFQNKIIYMPGLPPNARRERITDYINQCGGAIWQEVKIQSTDKTQLALCVGSMERVVERLETPVLSPVYILYFQG